MNSSINDNILKLSLNYQMENSKEYLDILYLKLNFLKRQFNDLDEYKPFFFQKKKMEKYLEEKKELENKISNCRDEIQLELDLMAKMNEN